MAFKEFSSSASTFMSRAKQLASENLADVPKTLYEPELLKLIEELEKSRDWTEKFVKREGELVQPNPALRAESFFNEAFDIKNPEKMTNSETFGMCLQDAAHDIDGATTNYTKGLKLFGSAERHIGTAERKFAREVQANCIAPMKQFLADDMKTAFKEKSHLDTLRLDLDVAKSKVNKAKTPDDKQKAEKVLEEAQKDFDRHSDFTKVLFARTVNNHHMKHAPLMKDLQKLQMQYYGECFQIMKELEDALKKEDF